MLPSVGSLQISKPLLYPFRNLFWRDCSQDLFDILVLRSFDVQDLENNLMAAVNYFKSIHASVIILDRANELRRQVSLQLLVALMKGKVTEIPETAELAHPHDGETVSI